MMFDGFISFAESLVYLSKWAIHLLAMIVFDGVLEYKGNKRLTETIIIIIVVIRKLHLLGEVCYSFESQSESGS